MKLPGTGATGGALGAAAGESLAGASLVVSAVEDRRSGEKTRDVLVRRALILAGPCQADDCSGARRASIIAITFIAQGMARYVW